MLYLHIGLPKTASTFLQQRVFPLLGHVTVRTMPRTRLFRTAADARAEFRAFACLMRRPPEVWADHGPAAMAEILGPDDDGRGSFLVSDEAIGRVASRPRALAAHLAAFAGAAAARGFGPPRIVAFVRRQDHWLASHYAQVSDRTPRASQAGFEAFVDATLDPAGRRRRFGRLLEYAALHDTLLGVAGERGVLVLAYEALVAEPEATLTRLLDWLGTPAPLVADIAAAPRARANVRSAGDGAAPAWRLRPPSIGLPSGRRVSVPHRLWPERRITLRPDLSARILESYADENARLAATAGIDLSHWDAIGAAPLN